eukprot:gene24776-30177_t
MSDKLAPTEEERHVFSHQGQKVYEWDQTLEEVNIYVDVPPGVKANILFCDIEAQHLKFGIKGNPPFLDAQTWISALEGHGQLDPLTAESDQKRLMLERFQQENPGFDFSGASFNGSVPDPRTFMARAKVRLLHGYLSFILLLSKERDSCIQICLAISTPHMLTEKRPEKKGSGCLQTYFELRFML